MNPTWSVSLGMGIFYFLWSATLLSFPVTKWLSLQCQGFLPHRVQFIEQHRAQKNLQPKPTKNPTNQPAKTKPKQNKKPWTKKDVQHSGPELEDFKGIRTVVHVNCMFCEQSSCLICYLSAAILYATDMFCSKPWGFKECREVRRGSKQEGQFCSLLESSAPDFVVQKSLLFTTAHTTIAVHRIRTPTVWWSLWPSCGPQGVIIVREYRIPLFWFLFLYVFHLQNPSIISID